MDENDKNLLIRIYKSEKNPVTRDRINAVCMIKISGLKPSKIVRRSHLDQRTTDSWIRSFDEDGLAGLDATPRPGMKGIRRWQQNTKEQIVCLEPMGFVTAVSDEDIFVNDESDIGKNKCRGGITVT